jgi:hypothetical protein
VVPFRLRGAGGSPCAGFRWIVPRILDDVLTFDAARTTPRRQGARRRAHRLAGPLVAAVLGLAALTACSNDNVDCGLNSCTVTLDRSVNASAEVLGVEAKFVAADANTVTLQVAGEQIQLTKGQQAVQVAGLQVSLANVTQDNVQVTIAK